MGREGGCVEPTARGSQDQVGVWRQWRVGEDEEDGVKQACAETDPKPGKEDEDDYDSLDGFAIHHL